jgi:hypothetical protein
VTDPYNYSRSYTEKVIKNITFIRNQHALDNGVFYYKDFKGNVKRLVANNADGTELFGLPIALLYNENIITYYDMTTSTLSFYESLSQLTSDKASICQLKIAK